MTLRRIGLGLLVFGLLLLAAGLWSGREHLRILRSWPEVAAEGAGGRVIDYRDEERKTMFRAEYELRYRLAGREYLIPISSNTSSSFRRAAEQEARKYEPGTRHAIRYNPDDPNEIRLNVGLTAGYFLLPLVFGGTGLLIAAVGLALALRPASKPVIPECPSCRSPVSQQHVFCPFCSLALRPSAQQAPAAPRPQAGRPATGLLVAGWAFAAAALALLGVAAVTSYQRHRIVSSWPQVEAVVTASDLRRSHDREGFLIFRPEIEFRYAVAGRRYVSSRASESGSDFAWACRQVAKYSPGTRHAIKYDPSDPSQIRFDAAYTLGFFLTPVATGGVGIIFSVLALAIIRSVRPAKKALCPACGAPLGAAWKFCPNCSLPVSR